MRIQISLSDDSLHKVYPNTSVGVKQMLKDNTNDRWYIKLQIDKCHIHPDPSVEGVWAVDNAATSTRIIVYLAGYKDPFGHKRDYNDFEEGQLPKK